MVDWDQYYKNLAETKAIRAGEKPGRVEQATFQAVADLLADEGRMQCTVCKRIFVDAAEMNTHDNKTCTTN